MGWRLVSPKAPTKSTQTIFLIFFVLLNPACGPADGGLAFPWNENRISPGHSTNLTNGNVPTLVLQTEGEVSVGVWDQHKS